jgi:hypothetical protein
MQFNGKNRYRMPIFFGPSGGPRQDENGKPFDWSASHRVVAAVNFLTEPSALEPLLPPGFTLEGEPVVTVEHYSLRNLPWLAGRGYDALGVRFPARFTGLKDTATGPLLTVMWENFCDAILTGREELGYAKIFADLPQPAVHGNGRTYTASWCGHQFLQMDLDNLVDCDPPAPAPSDGLLHHRYFPAVNNNATHDVSCVTITPSGAPTVTDRFQKGSGSVEFRKASWEQMPTQHHVVNHLAAMPVLEYRGASLAFQHGAKDLSDVRILR